MEKLELIEIVFFTNSKKLVITNSNTNSNSISSNNNSNFFHVFTLYPGRWFFEGSKVT